MEESQEPSMVPIHSTSDQFMRNCTQPKAKTEGDVLFANRFSGGEVVLSSRFATRY